MTTIERVIKITADNKKEYQKKINKEIRELRKRDLNYSIYESRYNSDERGYIAEILYEFEIEESYYEYYC